MRGGQGRTTKFKDHFSKATLAEDRLVTRNFLDNRTMVFWKTLLTGAETK